MQITIIKKQLLAHWKINVLILKLSTQLQAIVVLAQELVRACKLWEHSVENVILILQTNIYIKVCVQTIAQLQDRLKKQI